MAAIKALQQWCRIQVEGYRDVAITNMTTSFRDGLAFCALIHKFRPDLIDFGSLNKENVYDNNSLAFHVAEECLGIPALLDAEDMVALSVPDRLSILTYVSQYYNYFNGRPPIGGVKRPAEDSKEEPSEKKNLPVAAKTFNPKKSLEVHHPPTYTQNTSAQQKTVLVETSNKTGTLNSKCAVCKAHVHLVQRHLVDGKLYHRSCFKCSECGRPLLTGAYKAGPDPGAFVCNAHQNGCKPPLAVAFQKNGPTPAVSTAPDTGALASRTERCPQPATRPTSVLCSPIKAALPKPVDLRPAPQPWMASAQKTQAARQRFFQSPAPEEPIGRRQPTGPAEAGSAQAIVPSRPVDEKHCARALITKKLGDGNCNNNNTAYIPGLKTDNRFGNHLHSTRVPRRRQEKPSQGPAGGLAAHPSATLTPTSSTNSKETLWLAAINKERTRTPSALGAGAKDPDCSETSAHWRSRLKPVSNGAGLKTTKTFEATSQTPSKSKFSCEFSSRRTTELPSTQIFIPPDTRSSAGSVISKSPAMQPQKHPGNLGNMNGPGPIGSKHQSSGFQTWSLQQSCVSPCLDGPANHIASSLGKHYHGSAQSVSSNVNPISNGPSACWTTSISVSICTPGQTNQKAPPPRILQVPDGFGRNTRPTPNGPSATRTSSPSELANPIPQSPHQVSAQRCSKRTSPGKTSKTDLRSHTRNPNHIPEDEITKELKEIEENLNNLEKEGVDLEKQLRRCEEEGGGDVLMDPLMVDWFRLIQKKQSYIRRESELVYIVKTQELEEQQPGVEVELRGLLEKPEHRKSDAERRRQSELMDKLLEIINDRNAIVEGLDQDRLREEEEDQTLNEMMQKLSMKKSKCKRNSSISKLFRRRRKKGLVKD
ncbi:MICAL-like protein 2a isoform X2 [Denticeps clupeoides]|uniref:MICAL-like protein 2a isoform X2 n=1 Tax=Denticeps clupeoides TaxID=299321 RepID=UPI0010A451D5|nr:MICAL-like protein 2 isoform X2 [Denticeps clupeoides]